MKIPKLKKKNKDNAEGSFKVSTNATKTPFKRKKNEYQITNEASVSLENAI